MFPEMVQGYIFGLNSKFFNTYLTLKKIIRVTTVPSSLKVLLKGQLRFMSNYYEIVGVANPDEELNEVAIQEGIRTYPVRMTRTISPVRDLLAVFRLYRFLKKEQPFIVHTHTPKAGIVGMLAAWLAGVNNRFHTVAGMPLLIERGPKRWLLNIVEKLTYSLATRVFPNSKGLYEIIIRERFAPASKLKIIGQGSSNGIDVDHFNPEQVSDKQMQELKERIGAVSEGLVMVYIGRLVNDKGVNELVTAFDRFYSTDKNSKLILVGRRENELDPLDARTERLIESNPGIISVGWQDDVRPFLGIADFFVFPTYREGFPNVLLQAGAMGVPAIVTDINGCNEIVKDGINGIIIPTKNTGAVFRAMKLLAEEPATRRKMQAVARENIVVNYKQTYIWNELLKLYRSTETNQDVS